MNHGWVYLIGAGPGDPDLITVRGHRYLSQADVVVYDRLANKALLELVPGECELIYAGKRKHLHAMSQREINATLVARAQEGNRVVRLKGGDPFIFGRGGEETVALDQNDIRWEVVPGITAATGAAASAGLPLTHRDCAQAVTFVTAHKRDGVLDVDWELVMRPNQTVAFYMGFSVLEELVSALLERHQDPQTRFSIISNATRPNEKVLHTNLGSVTDHEGLETMSTPSILIMHNMLIQQADLPCDNRSDRYSSAAMFA